MEKAKIIILVLLTTILLLPIVPIKAGTPGTVTYSVTFGGAYSDIANSVAWQFKNPNGFLYVAGRSNSFSTPPASDNDAIIAQFDENLGGTPTVLRISTSGWDEFKDVSFDKATGNVFAAGYIGSNNRDAYVARIDFGTKSISWQKAIDFGGSREEFSAIKTLFTTSAGDGLGVAVGYTTNTFSGALPNENAIIYAFTTTSGSLLFAYAFDRPTGYSPSLATDAAIVDHPFTNFEAIYVVGYAFYNDYDGFLAKFDTSGTLAYYKTFGDGKREHPTAVTVCDNGDIYVAGSTNSFSAGGDYDAFVAKFDKFGTLIWFKTYSTTANDGATSITCSNGAIYISGITYTSGNADAFYAKLDTDGNLIYAFRSGLPGDDFGNKLNTNVHSSQDTFFVNLVGYSNAGAPSSFTSLSLTVSSQSVSAVDRTGSISIVNISSGLYDPNGAVTISDVSSSTSIPDNSGQRAYVYKFDPQPEINNNKVETNNNSLPLSIIYLMVSLAIATIIFLIRKYK